LYAVSAKEMREIEGKCINEYGISGLELMERASIKVLESIKGNLGDIRKGKFLLFVGKGNNGGDTLAVCRHLINEGVCPRVFLICKEEEIKGDALINLNLLKDMGQEMNLLGDKNINKTLEKSLNWCTFIVDGILGTGFRGELTADFSQIICKINAINKTVLSIDIPSGLNASTGIIPSVCIKASITVTFAFPKLGLIIHPGCQYTGVLEVADIGIPTECTKEFNLKISLIDEYMVQKLIPKRESDSNKGNYGRVLIVTGSAGMTGSGCLCALSALLSGAGLVYVAVPEELAQIYSLKLTEPIIVKVPSIHEAMALRGLETLTLTAKNKDVVVLGPGIGRSFTTGRLIEEFVKVCEKPMVIDADGLNLLGDLKVFKNAKAPVIITPHPGEMARIYGITVDEVQNNRIEVATKFAKEYNVIVVLKGSRTIVAFPDGRVYINPTGNAGMATAGTGDVLAGLIGGLLGQGLEPIQACIAGVYLHGATGDMVAAKKGQHGVIAGDIAEALPYCIKNLADTNSLQKSYK